MALKAADRRAPRSASTRRTRRRTRCAFLAELGNPYDAIGADANGRASIDWGVYGVPETFVVDAAGIITFKHIGPHHAGVADGRGDAGDRESQGRRRERRNTPLADFAVLSI